MTHLKPIIAMLLLISAPALAQQPAAPAAPSLPLS